MTREPTADDRLQARAAPAERPVMRQLWRHLAFLHWPVDHDLVARLLPPGLQPDTFDGVAYIGIIPFTIPLSHAAGLSLPLAPRFHELNFRTYVHRDGHSPGVWFFSLDATSRLAVLAARLTYSLPYFHAQIDMEVTGPAEEPTITYQATRGGRSARPAHFRCAYAPTGPATIATANTAAPGTLEFFLVERYRLYAWNGRALTEARVHHAPYPLHPAAITAPVTETLTQTTALPLLTAPPSQVHYVREVDVRIYRPHRVASH